MDKQDKELHWFDQIPKEESSKDEQKSRNRSKHNTAGMEKYLTTAYQWVDEVSVLMKNDERKDLAWNALRSVLHAIRDRLTPEEVLQLSAQLPMLIRGLFFEGYHFGNKPEKYHVEGLEDRIEDSFGPAQEIDARQAFKAVLLVLYDHVSEGELNDIYGNMPKDIRRLWDESLKTYTV